jgi:hypothetical protein
MSLLKNYHQLGHVVKDLDKAISHWTSKLGVGPFFVTRRLSFSDFQYLGKASSPIISMAISHVGETQIELIQQHNDAPSGYQGFLQAGHEGLQHLGVFSDHYERDLTQFLARGWHIEHQAISPMDGKTRFVYLSANGPPGSVIELLEMTAEKYQRFAHIRQVCEQWNVVDQPVQELGFKTQA